MKTVIPFLLLSALTLLIMSCYGGGKTDIDPEVRVYVDRFNEEALARGQNYQTRLEEIDINLAEIFSNGVLGQCVSNTEGVDAIQIDQSYWELSSTSDLDKEFVVFHELGHCVLERGHLNTPDMDGICLSIMYDGNSSSCTLDYNEDNRDQMIDELFQ